jgi:hypothetical protein
MNKEFKGILTLVFAVLVFSVLPASAAMVSIGNFNVAPGGTVTGSLIASGVTNLGSATVNLTYNPSVVIVTWVSAGSVNALNVPAYNINNVTGVVQIIANNPSGKSGNVIIANITFQAAGSAGQSCPLNIAIREFIDSGFNPITASPTNGSFIITGTPTTTSGGPNGGDGVIVPTATPMVTETVTGTQVMPTVTGTSSPSNTVTETQVMPTVTGASSPSPTKNAPAFEFVLTIAILSVAYLLGRKRR